MNAPKTLGKAIVRCVDQSLVVNQAVEDGTLYNSAILGRLSHMHHLPSGVFLRRARSCRYSFRSARAQDSHHRIIRPERILRRTQRVAHEARFRVPVQCDLHVFEISAGIGVAPPPPFIRDCTARSVIEFSKLQEDAFEGPKRLWYDTVCLRRPWPEKS